MIYELGRLECRICGRTIYFPLAETEVKGERRLIELTCSRGHTDAYWDVQAEELTASTIPEPEFARAAAVGF